MRIDAMLAAMEGCPLCTADCQWPGHVRPGAGNSRGCDGRSGESLMRIDTMLDAMNAVFARAAMRIR